MDRKEQMQPSTIKQRMREHAIEFSTRNTFNWQFHIFIRTFSINAHAQLGHGSHGVKSAKLKYILYYRPSIVTEPEEMRRLIDIYSK